MSTLVITLLLIALAVSLVSNFVIPFIVKKYLNKKINTAEQSTQIPEDGLRKVSNGFYEVPLTPPRPQRKRSISLNEYKANVYDVIPIENAVFPLKGIRRV